MPFFYMDYWYIVLVLPAIVFSLIAQGMVKSSYNKYAKVMSKRRVTGREVAENILHSNGINNVRVEYIKGTLNDHYSPKEGVIRLSDGVYSSASVAALGIAAHEAGHAVQYHENYSPVRIRNNIVPLVNVVSTLSMPLIFIGFFLGSGLFVDIGIVLFGIVVFFQLITLPVEFNASSRAMAALEGFNTLDSDELKSANKVLKAAAMTYVASLAVSFAQLLRLILLSNSRKRR